MKNDNHLYFSNTTTKEKRNDTSLSYKKFTVIYK